LHQNTLPETGQLTHFSVRTSWNMSRWAGCLGLTQAISDEVQYPGLPTDRNISC